MPYHAIHHVPGGTATLYMFDRETDRDAWAAEDPKRRRHADKPSAEIRFAPTTVPVNRSAVICWFRQVRESELAEFGLAAPEAPDAWRVPVNDGKYTVVFDGKGHLSALRYGEPWGRDLVGDNLVYWLAVELREARELLQKHGLVATGEGVAL